MVKLPREATEQINGNERRNRDVFQLNQAEMELINCIREIRFGEIRGLEIKDQSPVRFEAATKTYKV